MIFVHSRRSFLAGTGKIAALATIPTAALVVPALNSRAWLERFVSHGGTIQRHRVGIMIGAPLTGDETAADMINALTVSQRQQLKADAIYEGWV